MHSSYKCVKVQKVFTVSLLSWLKKSEIDKAETEAVELTDTAELTTSDPLLGKPVQPSYQNDQSTMPKHPHQPIITFPLRKFGSQHRAFCSVWYKRYQWLHDQEYNDSVLCFYCFVADKKHLPITRNKDDMFCTTGFSNWKKAL